jgi:hypothetical protein
MSIAPSTTRDFARRLVALEQARGESTVAAGSAVGVCERLRGPLQKLAGVAGFSSLLARALAMARAEVPALEAVQVRPDGSLVGFDGIGQGHAAEAGVVLAAHLLGLLEAFIGEALTLRLVRDAWPNVSVTEMGTGNGEGQ